MDARTIILDALYKALDTTKLVLVQRVRHDKTGDHITKKWITPDKVKKTDKVLNGAALLGQNTAADAKGTAGPAKPKASVSPMAKLAALQKKNGKSKAAVKPAPAKSTALAKDPPKPVKPVSVPKPVKPVNVPKPVKPVNVPKPKKVPITYAKNEETAKPAAKPPIVRSDILALGRGELPEAKIKVALESVRADADGTALTEKAAQNAREKAYVSVLNTINNPILLKKIAYTGIIPEDAGAASFMENKLYEHYREIRDTPGNPPPGAVASISMPLQTYFPDVPGDAIKNALRSTSLTGPDFVFRMTYPAESAMLLGSLSRGNRQVFANSDTMRYTDMATTAPSSVISTGKWFAQKGETEADGLRTLVQYISDREPTLSKECKQWAAELDDVMAACGGDTDRMNMALNNTYDRVSDVFSADEYNRIVGGVLGLYGASLSDGGSTAFDGDYTQLSAADCLRMTYSTTGSIERQAVMANIINACHVMSFAQNVYESSQMNTSLRFDTSQNTYADVVRNTSILRTMSRDDFRTMQEYVSNTTDRPGARESNPNYTRSVRAQIAYRAGNGNTLFSTDPSPVLDAFRHVIESAADLGTGAPGALSAVPYDQASYKPAEEFDMPEFGGDELLGLRTMAFANATCTMQSVTGNAYDKIKTEVEFVEEAPEYSKNAAPIYDERQIIVRGAYSIRNSVFEEKFQARCESDGKKKTEIVYHGAGFAAGCGILHDGQFRISSSGSNSGATLGPGVYVGRSTGKVAPYAATAPGTPYAAEIAELMYDGSDNYSKNDFADGVIFKMRLSRGKKCVTSKTISGARKANRNCGGKADVAVCTGYKAWEAVVSDSALLCPEVIVDTGLRYKYVDSYVHHKNQSRMLNQYGPRMGLRTNRKDDASLMDYYVHRLSWRER